MRMVAAFVESKSIEAYFDVGEGIEPHAVGLLAEHLGFDDYEVTGVEPVSADVSADVSGREPALEVASMRCHGHPATIMQILLQPDGRTLSIRARHRRHETIQGVDVDETDREVRVEVLVAIPPTDRYAGRVSFAVDFSVVRVRLDQPLDDRRVVGGGTVFSLRGEEGTGDLAHASAEEVLARLERYVAALHGPSAEQPAPPDPLVASVAPAAPAGTERARRRPRVWRRPIVVP
jgi:hypothetical protein